VEQIVTGSEDYIARVWNATWTTQVRGAELRRRVCTELLIGSAQEFTSEELKDTLLADLDASECDCPQSVPTSRSSVI
jgi:hypothetical protein